MGNADTEKWYDEVLEALGGTDFVEKLQRAYVEVLTCGVAIIPIGFPKKDSDDGEAR